MNKGFVVAASTLFCGAIAIIVDDVTCDAASGEVIIGTGANDND
jgi:hypothetical protein